MIVDKRKEEQDGRERERRRKGLYNFQWVHVGSRALFHIFFSVDLYLVEF